MSVIFNPASVTGGGGMSIGGAITGGTPNTALFVGPSGVLAQTAVPTVSGQVMTWNGSTWAPTAGGGGGMSIGGAVTGGTNLSVLFINPAGVLAQDNPHFTFDPVSNILDVGVTGDLGRY